jgi:hypothetical protein
MRALFSRGRSVALLLASVTAGCAGSVGIDDVPRGDAGHALVDGGRFPLLDGGRILLPDGAIVSLDAFVPPPPDGGVVGPGTDGTTKIPDGGTGSALTYQPSNIGSLTFNASITGPLTLNDDSCFIYTDDQGISCGSGQNPPMDMFMVTMPGGGQAVVFAFTYISIDADSTLAVRGTLPAIIIALGALDLKGTIDVSADNYDSDSDINVIPGSLETGPGVGAYGNNGGPQGGGGGSFCGTGGYGAPGVTGGFGPGAPYGTASLSPLLGGSAGGGITAGGADQSNGHGGGTIQISAAGTIQVESGAVINANGSGGVSQGNEQGLGGGSGGSILLEAPTVVIAGLLEANGGEGSDDMDDGADPPVDGGVAETPGCVGGVGSAAAQINGGNGQMSAGGYGGGGGGAGRIRINGTNVTLSGAVTPSVASGCASQGALP